jgi:chemosensory pili system protein ChpC
MDDENPGPVRCMYLPLVGGGLLVPSAAVAEIIVVPTVESLDDAPGWLTGLVNWRGVRLPLLSVEAALGSDKVALSARGRVAVLHALDDSTRVPFYAIGIQRLPTVVLAAERTAEMLEPDVLADWVNGQMRLEVGDALIPDLAILESMVMGAMPTATA